MQNLTAQKFHRGPSLKCIGKSVPRWLAEVTRRKQPLLRAFGALKHKKIYHEFMLGQDDAAIGAMPKMTVRRQALLGVRDGGHCHRARGYSSAKSCVTTSSSMSNNGAFLDIQKHLTPGAVRWHFLAGKALFATYARLHRLKRSSGPDR
jgi:hypothetical protein